MPSNKFKTRFPPARIKKIMQTDEEVGKLSCAVPVIVSKSVELFTEILLHKSGEIALGRGARTLSIDHIKQCVEQEHKFDFLREIVREAAAKAIGKSSEDVANSGQAEAGTSANDAEMDSVSKDKLVNAVRHGKLQQPGESIPSRSLWTFNPGGKDFVPQAPASPRKLSGKPHRHREPDRSFRNPPSASASIPAHVPEPKQKANALAHSAKTHKTSAKNSGSKMNRSDKQSPSSSSAEQPKGTPAGRFYTEHSAISEPVPTPYPPKDDFPSSSHFHPYHVERLPAFQADSLPEYSTYPSAHGHYPYQSPPSMVRMPPVPAHMEQMYNNADDLTPPYYGAPDMYGRDQQMLMYQSAVDYSNHYSSDEPLNLQSPGVQDLSRKRPLDLSDQHPSLNSYSVYERYGN
ncbi:uncharacterized protein LOC129591261 [Paramacrobiotus metropolitanus]|uniref:uncharacterized protein LOC129591261 n=1 Tax=Paramacrobiotus metropolitanus TaxID=2943436 RepID=UPI002445BC3D|nr:uncharacterized protein LOC129591261 [Paramacrobiotus metropolitanus]XP_055342824.1 uncharacterized protein LOC129591261 [Paramacrobiotus metropolitanus]